MSVEGTLGDYIIGLKHVGHVVDDLDAALAVFRKVYGVDDSAIRRVPEDPGSGAPTLFAFITIGGSEFELIQPNGEQFRQILDESPKGGAGINHVAWQVSDIRACMDLLAGRGIRPGHVTPDGVVEFDDRKLVYLDPADTGGLLIELLEIG